MILYCRILLAKKGTEAKLGMKTSHFIKTFIYHTFFIDTPGGAITYFMESADQDARQEQRNVRQSPIDELKASIKRLKELFVDVLLQSPHSPKHLSTNTEPNVLLSGAIIILAQTKRQTPRTDVIYTALKLKKRKLDG